MTSVILVAGLRIHQWICMGLGAVSLAGVQRDLVPEHTISRLCDSEVLVDTCHSDCYMSVCTKL